MNYLVTYDQIETISFSFNCIIRQIQLKSMAELKEFILLLPDSYKIYSVKEIQTHNDLNDFKVELLKNQENDIEMGKLKQTLDN